MHKLSGALSKTMLFNIIYGVLAVLAIALDWVGYSDFTPDPMVVTIVSSVVVPLVNVVLRKYFTSEAIA